MVWNEDNLERFMRLNKDKFDSYAPKNLHTAHFLNKLAIRFKIIVSIVPYLIKVGFVAIVIFICSYLMWNNFIRNDKDQMALGEISWNYKKLEASYKAEVLLLTREARKKANKNVIEEIQSSDTMYVRLKKDLKIHPNDQRIIDGMMQYYQTKINTLRIISQADVTQQVE